MAESIVHNAADVRQVNAVRRNEKELRRRRQLLVKHAHSTYEGREKFWDDLDRLGTFAIVEGSMELVFAANERKNVGCRAIVEAQAVCPELYVQGYKEALERVAALKRSAKRQPPSTVTEESEAPESEDDGA